MFFLQAIYLSVTCRFVPLCSQAFKCQILLILKYWAGVENEAEETLEQGCAATPGLESQVRRAAQRECKSFYNRERPLIDNNCFL